VKPTRHDFSYLAGLLDGEGCVGHFRNGATKPRMRFSIEIKMAHEPTIDWLVATFGGSKISRPAQNARWKPQWRWRVTDNAAKELYDKISPLLKIKGGHYF